ncbi:MAG: Calcium-gated potassium channel MthK [Candidatus Methanophagaceae archaeon]|nr:MAG: Calcium-gated potassium channel MthK [Methanophagales archaeon]
MTGHIRDKCTEQGFLELSKISGGTVSKILSKSDFYPETTGGRITFVLVALGGIGTIAYVIEQLVSFSTKSALKKLFGTGAVKMKQHTIIVGWNTKAEEAVKELKSVNEVFLVVGSELDHTELDAQEIPHISGDPTKSETLNRCGIEDAKTLMIPLENDSETIMIALATRKLNPGIKIVATCEAREHVEMMRGAGIDHIISYAEISGRLLAHAVTEPVVVNFIMDASTSVEGFDLKQIKVGEKTKLSEISLKENERVIALYESGRFVFDFTADVMLEEGDYLVVISSSR